ncbi:hypothetical protein ACQP1P_20115 [Dactylosporangium sp. CA-052675]|uniref:hypothetical protein n=1 Tax=Dactylosporangium sp. CA-052675 TaxID=3239927 RepID=UPI003D8B8C67
MTVTEVRPTSMASAARGWATASTIALPIVRPTADPERPRLGTDPVDSLAAEVRAAAGDGQFVDGLHLAALLEARGVTDRAARVRYGHRDVFELAEAVRARLAGPAVGPPSRPQRRREWRELFHGGLYLLPSVLFPAVVAAVPRSPVAAVVAAGLLGWVWAGGLTWLAYQHVNEGDDAAAGRLLARGAVCGVAVAAVLGAAVAAMSGVAAAALLVPAVTAYQLASTVLVFYRAEARLLALMSPAVVAGGGFVLARWWPPAPVIAAALVCTVVTFGVALRRALRAPGDAAPGRLRPVMRGRWGTFALVVLSTALLAALVLLPQAPLLAHHFEVLLATLPLVVSMGFVEWRARRFGERARDLLHEAWGPGGFRRRLWWRLALDVCACGLVAAVAGAVVLAGLREAGRLTPAAQAMAAASVLLAGAVLLVFVLAAHGGYGRLCVALAGALGAQAAAPFLGSVALLLVLLAVALIPSLGRVRQYR